MSVTVSITLTDKQVSEISRQANVKELDSTFYPSKEVLTPGKRRQFSVRVNPSDFAEWGAYAMAAGVDRNVICTYAMREFMENHPLPDSLKPLYENYRSQYDF